MKKIAEAFSGHVYLLRVVMKNEKWYLLAILLYIMLDFVQPFLMIIPPKYILDGLAEGNSLTEVLPAVLLMAGSYFVVHTLIQSVLVWKGNFELRLKISLNVAMSDKYMQMDYADLESNDTIHAINSARLAVNGGLTYAQSIGLSGSQGIGGYFTQLCNFVSNLLKMTAMLYILKELKLWVIVVIATGTAIHMICGYVKKQTNVILRNYAAPFLRKNQYCNRTLRSAEAGKDIRLYELEDYLLDKFSECNDNYIDAKNRYRNRIVMADILSAVCSGGVTFAVFFSLIFLLGRGSITVGGFTMTASTVIGLFGCGIAMVAEWMDLDIHSVFMRDYRKFMDCKSAVSSSGRKISPGAHTIRFENVSFSYRDSEQKALDHVSVTINGGETISIVGRNGAGKSTFIKLLTGLYRPTEGIIWIDNIPIDEFDRDSLADYFSVLFQDFHIYPMSVEENVTFTHKSDTERLEKSLEESGILERIERMKDTVKTPVRDAFRNDSEALSGGEEQKLALARVFYKDSDFLILDEPTAALDAMAECEIYTNILQYLQGQTVLFVSHRMTSSRFCDRILVFDNGKIMEEGNHSKLVKDGGIYTKMWNTQAKYYEGSHGGSGV